MSSDTSPNSPFYKLGRAYEALKDNPFGTIGNAGLTAGRYGVCMSVGASLGAGVGAAVGAAAIKRSNNGSVIGFPIITALCGGAFGTAAGIFCAYNQKNIWSTIKDFGAKARNDFVAGSGRNRNS